MKNLSLDNSSVLKNLDVSDNECLLDELDDSDENITLQEAEKENILEKETSYPARSNDFYELKLCRKKNIRINKSLLTFRITQFIWYGGGILPSLYFGIFLKQRGLTLVELSSIFSMIFIFQFITCSIIGIIADKLGNAKPVLIALMLSSFCLLVILLLTPNINTMSCKVHENYLNNTELTELKEEFRSCFMDCTFKNKSHISLEENYDGSSVIQNSSHVEGLVLEVVDSNSICKFFNIQTMTLDSSRNYCCSSCVNTMRVDCVKVRNKYLVALYAVIILAYYSVYSTTYRLLNFSAVSLAEKSDSDFGKELSVGRSADILVLIIIAFVLNIDISSGSDINFNPIFYVGASIMFCAFITSFTIKIPILPPGKNLMKKAFKLAKDIDTLVFILLIFISGSGYAFYITFHLIFLETMNASSTLVSLHSITLVIYCFPFLLTSEWWLKKLGAKKLFVLGFVFRGINYLAYSYMRNPWWTLIIDMCFVFSDDLFWVAVVQHCWTVAPVGFAATFVASTGSVHYGIGRSAGVFFGGMMMNYLGPRMTYRIMSAIFFVTAFLYSLVLYKRRKAVEPSYNYLHNEW